MCVCVFIARSVKTSGIGRLLVTILEATELKAAKPNGEHESTCSVGLKNTSSAVFFFFFMYFCTLFYTFLFADFLVLFSTLLFPPVSVAPPLFLNEFLVCFTCFHTLLLVPFCRLLVLQVKATLTVKWPWELRSSHPELSMTPWTPSGILTVSFTSETSTRTSSASPSMKETSFHLMVSYKLITSPFCSCSFTYSCCFMCLWFFLSDKLNNFIDWPLASCHVPKVALGKARSGLPKYTKSK